MKKAQMLKFLFWTIVGLAFFIPACMLGSNFMSLGDSSLDSYSNLIETVESIGEGELASISFSMSKKSVVVGFSKADNGFENHLLHGPTFRSGGKNDDYCICGNNFNEDHSHKGDASCNTVCGVGNCIMGIEEGGSDGGTVKKCTDKFDFDDSRDYCICGAGSEKFPASPPASLLADVEMSCNTLCGTSGCIMGIDDGGDVRRCSAKFRFEKKEVDDYCICGKDSAEVIPGTCNDICGARGKTCVNGMDDEDTLKKCNVGFGFEVDSGTELDDYCICGDEDKITPKTCEDFCYPAGCIMGIDDGGQEEMCGAMFGFEGASTPKRDYLKQLGVENGCEVGKACICLCNGYKWDTKTKSVSCEDIQVCHSFDKIDILSSKIANRYDDGQPEYVWKGGFLIKRDISNSIIVNKAVNGLEKNDIVTKTFYVQKYKGVVDVCLESPCMTQEAVHYIDTHQSQT
tara:strand:+ start:1194 stop:2567 length:1374 start_codon:yes stop_codon:yes gene_type:complete